MSEWKRCPKCQCMNLNREVCVDCGCDLKGVDADAVQLGRRSSLAAPAGSADWDITLCANVVANCRQQIERLRMKMPMNVAIALGEADRALADAQAWMRAESNFGNYSAPNTQPAHPAPEPKQSQETPGALMPGEQND